MATEIVQFREDPEALAYLRTRGINPNTFAREAFEAMLRGIRARETAEDLGRVQARLPRPVEELIREDRDGGHGLDAGNDRGEGAERGERRAR